MIICPHCQCTDNRVRDTKQVRVKDAIVRYRTCFGCFREFVTHERVVICTKKGPKPQYMEAGGKR
jgi:transcriptional regulator NrdR family protein